MKKCSDHTFKTWPVFLFSFQYPEFLSFLFLNKRGKEVQSFSLWQAYSQSAEGNRLLMLNLLPAPEAIVPFSDILLGPGIYSQHF